MKKAIAFAAVCLAVLGVSVGAADLDLSDAAAVAHLEADLASPEFAVREAAQKQLATVPREKLDDLRRLAQSAKDAEVAARLATRVQELEGLVATDPPGISLQLADDDLNGVAMALARATGRAFDLTTDIPRGTFTLRAQGLPFWEVYRQLYAQAPFEFTTNVYGLGISGHGAMWNQMQVHRGFAVFLKNPGRAVAAVVGDVDGAATYISVIHLGIDPRIKIATFGAPAFTRVIDDLGNSFPIEMPAPSAMQDNRSIFTTHTFRMKTPATRGKTLTLAGSWPVQLAEESRSVSITDFSKPPAAPVELGDVQITFQAMSLEVKEDSTLKLSLQSKSRAGSTTRPIRTTDFGTVLLNNGPPLEITLMDGAGRVISSSVLPNAVAVSATLGAPGRVAKMVMTYPERVREYKVPFEFKNLSMPGK